MDLNPAIKWVQHALNTVLVIKPRLIEDGINGPITIKTVRRFQRNNDLLETDGFAGPQTIAELERQLDKLTDMEALPRWRRIDNELKSFIRNTFYDDEKLKELYERQSSNRKRNKKRRRQVSRG